MLSGLPPIHLINLDRSVERLRRFKEHNGHLKDVTRVSAVDGSTVNRDALVRSGYVDLDCPYAAGTLGNALSHVQLWEMSVAQDRSLTVFEDDVVVVHEFEKRAESVLSALPADWDIVQWGYSLGPSFVWVDLGISKVRLHCYGPRNDQSETELRKFQTQEFPAGPVKLCHSYGMQAYSISPKGARVALDYCLPLRSKLVEYPHAGVRIWNEAIANVLCGLYPSVNAFICIPQLVIHRDDRESVRASIDHERKAPFPEVFVINLDNRTDRWATIEATCRAAGITPIRIPAIQESPGWRGCGLSHLKCISLAKERKLPWVLILEDDASFTPEAMRRFRGLLDYLWDNRDNWERFNGGPMLAREPGTIKVLNRQQPLLYVNSLATHFYLVHSGAYDEILKWVPERDGTFDGYYVALGNRPEPLFRSIATFPHISVQVATPSDVRGGQAQVDYSNYMRFSEIKLRQCLEKEYRKASAADY